MYFYSIFNSTFSLIKNKIRSLDLFSGIVYLRKGGAIELFITLVLKVFILNVFLFVGLPTLGIFFDWLVHCVFQPLIVNYKIGNFVYPHWGCTGHCLFSLDPCICHSWHNDKIIFKINTLDSNLAFWNDTEICYHLELLHSLKQKPTVGRFWRTF